jgi:antitoxin Phd
MQISATELKNRLGRYLGLAETEPVIVEKSGRSKSVLISHELYRKYLALEDAFWAEQACQAEGYLLTSRQVVQPQLKMERRGKQAGTVQNLTVSKIIHKAGLQNFARAQ